MKKLLNISIVICLLAAKSGMFFSIDQGNSIHSNKVYVNSGDSLQEGEDAFIFSALNHILLIAEITQENPSEIDPQKSFSAEWSTIQNTYTPQFQYLIRSERFLISQSVRDLIFPFHSFL